MQSEGILTVLELVLALVLFADASRIDVTRLREGYSWPLRMLVFGLPLAVAMGALLAGWALGSAPVGIALLVGVTLAPTDAALAAPVLESDSVPARIRQTLNVESGLNDGLALPFLLIAIGLVESEEGRSPLSSIGLVLAQLGIGIAGGLVIGWLGAKLIGKGGESGRLTPIHQKIAAVALALTGFAAVQLLGGSGFVATFIAGGLMSHLIRPKSESLYEFAEAEGHSLVLLAFFIFGAGPAAELLTRGVAIEAIIIGLASLVVVRPLAIAASLVGQRLSRRTVVFLGWFGPRGLATIVFALVAWEELGMADPVLTDVVNFTVLSSIVLHGLSAVPMSGWVASMRMTDDMPEMGEAFAHPMR
jgi:NhaP-type Na+/H+ or K+/H+ antiporter